MLLIGVFSSSQIPRSKPVEVVQLISETNRSSQEFTLSGSGRDVPIQINLVTKPVISEGLPILYKISQGANIIRSKNLR